MKEKFRAYLPIWFLMMVPPAILFLLAYNFIFSGLALVVTLLYIKDKDAFSDYSKNIGKVWFVALLLDIIGTALLLVPELFYKVEFFQKNLIYPLEHNPYTKVLSVIYIVLLFVFLFWIGLRLVRRFVTRKLKLDDSKRRTITITITVFILPYIFFVPSSVFYSSEKSTLEDFRGTLLNNKEDIVNLVRHLNISNNINSYVLETNVEPHTLNFYLKNMDTPDYLHFEQDAATIFNLIDNVNEVNFYIDGKVYVYTINKINVVFKDIKNLSIGDIAKQYSDSKYEEYIYYGTIGKYLVFDTSEYCLEDEQLLFKVDDFEYYVTCTELSKIMLYSGDEKYSLTEAIEKKLITEEDVMDSRLNITRKFIGESNS